MFEQLIVDAESRFNLSTIGVSSLVRELLALIVNGRDGAEGFVDHFSRAGLMVWPRARRPVRFTRTDGA